MFEKFYEQYEEKEQEVIALVQEVLGATPLDDFQEVCAFSLGMVFCATGEVDIREGRLHWLTNRGEEFSENGFKRFEKMEICRLKLCKMRDECVPKHTTPEKFNAWLIVEVLEKSVSCPELQAVIDEYNKPVTVEDDVLGRLTLDKEYGMLETKILWNGKKIPLTLEVNKDNPSTWTRARNAAKKFLAEQQMWDKSMPMFVAQQLLQDALEWQESDEKPLTVMKFAKRITLTHLVITSGGSFTAYFDDDDIFYGHTIEVCGSVSKRSFKSADIAG